MYGCILHGVHDSTYITYMVFDIVVVCVASIVAYGIEYMPRSVRARITVLYISCILSNVIPHRVRLKRIMRHIVVRNR